LPSKNPTASRRFSPDISQGRIDGAAAHEKLEAGIGQRRRDPVPRRLHRRIRQPEDDDNRLAPTAIAPASTGQASMPLTAAEKTRASMGGLRANAGARKPPLSTSLSSEN
jgi:hypothetical protein